MVDDPSNTKLCVTNTRKREGWKLQHWSYSDL